MQNVFIINAHEPWPFSEGQLNRSMVGRATANLKKKGYAIQMKAIIAPKRSMGASCRATVSD